MQYNLEAIYRYDSSVSVNLIAIQIGNTRCNKSLKKVFTYRKKYQIS